ncbi:MAG TPA: ClpXP protease specificity-enhancing factor SspB [Xanthobacteraceae bacterium]
MPDHYIRYDLLAQQALRGVVRTVLADVAKKGLPGEHHFKITFDTVAPGVRLSDRLRAQYPETMTIILQHQFWDLTVAERGFEVGLSFGGITERLTVPFDAIVAFHDPAVQFGFQFEPIDAAADERSDADKLSAKLAGRDAEKGAQKSSTKRGEKTAEKTTAPAPQALPAGKRAAPVPPADEPPAPPPGTDGGAGGGEVVRLDRFRKK